MTDIDALLLDDSPPASEAPKKDADKKKKKKRRKKKSRDTSAEGTSEDKPATEAAPVKEANLDDLDSLLDFD